MAPYRVRERAYLFPATLQTFALPESSGEGGEMLQLLEGRSHPCPKASSTGTI